MDQQRETVASSFTAVAQAFRGMGEDLKKQDKGPVAGYAAELGEAVGGQVERLANYVRESDVRQLVGDAEGFARRSPAIFLGAAFVLGVAASRFLKSARPAPDVAATMPDPARALPAATTPPALLGPTQPASSQPATTPAAPPFWAAQPDVPSEGGPSKKPAATTSTPKPTPVGSNPAGTR